MPSIETKPTGILRSNQKLDRRDQKALNYENSQLKDLVSETNVAGRQSVRNLLEIYTPQVQVNGSPVKYKSEQKAERPPASHRPFSPGINMHRSTPEPGVSHDYNININIQKGAQDPFRSRNHPNAMSAKTTPLRSLQQSSRKTTVRNSEGYVLFRS